MKWKEDEYIGEREYQRALFDLDIARRLAKLENPNTPPPKPICPVGMMSDGTYKLSFELVSELRKFNIPKPQIEKKRWWQ